ncbi:helix-turn-helix domain-containing protein [Nocardiopsis sp. LOL_012]|uniref:helix-turn-helix domain-containing protein n=1 Tax=Nocardiopsis sp. LOL_012 TaxID=3345409 RepID=UPI003A86B6A8
MEHRLPYSPSVRRRRLSAELRRLRESCGMTAAQAAGRAGWPQSKVTKIELGERKNVTVQDLAVLCEVYGVHDPKVREALEKLARDAKQRGWWSKYKDVFTDLLPDFETEARIIRTYECQVVPGLLQLPEYIEAVFRGGQVHEPDVIERAVAARLRRQEILNRFDPPELWAVLDEAALRRRIGGPEVMRKQLQHLIHMAARHNITIQVVPFGAGEHAALVGSFVILDFPAALDPSLAYAETYTASLMMETTAELTRYNAVFGHLQGSALSAAESVKLLETVMSQLE